MPLRTLLSILLAAAGVAHAAPPSTAPPDIDVDAIARAKDAPAGQPPHAEKTTPATTSAQDVDVDALARAKDVDAHTSAAAAPTAAPQVSPASAPPVRAEAAPAEVPAANQAPPSQAAAIEPAAVAPTPGAAPTPQSAATAATPAAAKPPVSDDVKRLGATCDARATSLLDAAQRGDFATATHDFDAKMRTAMTPENFQKSWAELGRFGTLVARGQSTIEKSDDYFAVGVPLMFEKADLFAQITCGSDGRVAGFHVKPLAKSKTAPPAKP